MAIPDSIENIDKRNNVRRLQKALHGLCISPKQWYIKLYPFQSCIFMWSNRGKIIFVLLYVDDILIVGNYLNMIEKCKLHLLNFFEMKDMGFPSKFVGLELTRVEKTIFINQKKINTKILNKFGMSNCKPVSTPMVPVKQNSIQSYSDSKEKVLKFPFREIIDILLYLATRSRPDIAFSVNVLRQRQSAFAEVDIVKVKRILKYLKRTLDLSLKIEGEGENIECYVDSSLDADFEGGSACGWLIIIFGDVIAYAVKRQRHVALSSAEA